MGPIWQDLRYALRVLGRAPGFTLVAVLTLGLGIGANTAIFSLVNTILLKPIPAAQPQQLIRFYSTSDAGPTGRVFSYPNFLGFREQNAAFVDLVAVSQALVSLRSDTQNAQLLAEVVSGNYFSLLGVSPTQGRMFSQEEDRPGASGVAVISDSLWRRLGPDPGLVGKTLNLNGGYYTVVGIAPPDFSGIMAGAGIDLWVPVSQATSWMAPDLLTNREAGRLQILGRLREGITLEEARAAMGARARQLEQAFPDANRGKGVRLERARYLDIGLRGAITAFLSIVMVLAAMVLLIVCANLTNLHLVRLVGRRREMAVRQALGASRGRLTRQLLTESVLVGSAGGAVGLVLGIWGGSLLTRFNPLPDTIPLRFDLSPDYRVVLFALGSSLLAGVLLGVVPALRMSRSDLLSTLEGGGSLGSRKGSRLRNSFIVSQVAISAALLIGAGLFLRSLGRARGMDIGFDPQHVLALDLDLKPKGFSDQRGAQFYKELLRRLEALPGIQAATLSNLAPLDTATPYAQAQIPGHQPPAGKPGMRISFNRIGPGYFETLGIPLRTGRGFSELDDRSRPGVAVVNETMARLYWPGDVAIGKQFRLVRDKETSPTIEVVGVARDVKYRSLGEEPTPHLYIPFLQDYDSAMTVLVRTAGDPGAAIVVVQRELANQDPDVHGFFARTGVQHIGLALLPARLAAWLSGLSAAAALLLAILGLYGVVSYSMGQRTREIGLRMALGAQSADVLRLALAEGERLALIGIGIGLGGAFALTRFLSGLLYETSALDPPTFAGVSLGLAAVMLTACYLPALRASRVDPMVALRHE